MVRTEKTGAVILKTHKSIVLVKKVRVNEKKVLSGIDTISQQSTSRRTS